MISKPAASDFVITDSNFRPITIVEYDGRSHVDDAQREKDKIKDHLCKIAGIGLLRIHSRHVTKLYRGMTLLRWIIEVCEHQRWWYTAQADGQLPFDEPFDPAFIDPGDSAQRFPYWLSAPATQTIHSFLKKIDPQVPKGWTVFFGRDELDTGYRLSCLYFGDKVLWSKTAVRKQELDFPQYDLLSELDICELGIQLNKFRQGEIAASSTSEFRSVFETFCQRFKVDLSHSMGAFPIHGSWDPIQGWRTRQ